MRKVFIYYHCDAWVSVKSKRIERVFADTIKGRKALADCIVREVQEDAIELDIPSDLNVENVCVNQTPIILNDYMVYGFIETQIVEG